MIFDDDNNPVDYEFVETNELFNEIFTLKEFHLAGKRVTQIVSKIKRNIFNWIYLSGKIALAGEKRSFEYFAEPINRWFHILIHSPKQHYFVCTCIDITEKKRLQEYNKIHSMSDFFIELDENYILRRFISLDENYQKVQDIFLNSHINNILNQFLVQRINQVLEKACITKTSQYIELEFEESPHKKCYGIKIRYQENGPKDRKYLIAINNIDNKHLIKSHYQDIPPIKTDNSVAPELFNYSTFINTLDDILIVADMYGNLLFVNHAFEEKLGCSKKEISHMHILDLSGKRNMKLAEMFFNEVLSGQREYYPLDLADKDGRPVPAETRIWNGRWFGKKCIFILAKDITKKSEELSRFREIFNFNPVVMALIGIKSFCIKDINLAFLVRFGFSKDELLKKNAEEIFISLNISPDHIQSKIREGIAFANMETSVHTKNGERITCLLSSQPVSDSPEDLALLTFSDIKKTSALQKSEAYRFIEKILLEVSSALSCENTNKAAEAVHKSLTKLAGFFGAERASIFRLTGDNELAANANELCIQNMIGKTLELRETSKDPMKSRLERFLEQYDIDIEFISGSPKSLDIEEKYLKDNALIIPICPENQLSGFIQFDFMNDVPKINDDIKNLLMIYAHDIGSLWNREKREKRSKETLREANLNSSKFIQPGRMKNRLIADTSHEIRTLINSVLGSSYLLQQTEATASQKKYIQTIQCGGQALLEIANNALESSAIEAGIYRVKKAKFSLHEIYENAIRLFELQASQKGIEIVSYIDFEIPGELLGDKTKISHIVNNLMSNAVKFSSEGTIRLLCELKSRNAQAVDILIKVEDDSPGMDQKDASHVFDEFWQGEDANHSETGGTGLGLSICKRIVEIMGGEIRLETRKGHGCSFEITLPVEAADFCSRYEMDYDLAKKLAVWVYDENFYHCEYVLRTFSDYGIPCRANVHKAELLEKICNNNKLNVLLIDSALKNKKIIPAINAMNGGGNISIYFMDQANVFHDPNEESGYKNLIPKPVTAPVLFDQLIPSIGGRAKRKDATDETSPLFADAKVLVVDDSRVQIDIAAAILRQYGIDCDMASNGKDAIQKAQMHTYNLILMDIHMESINGIEVIKKIRTMKNSLNKSIPILALTARTINKNLWKTINIDGCITKPIHPMILFNTLVAWIPHKIRKDKEGGVADDAKQEAKKTKALDINEGLKLLSNDDILYRKLLKKLLDTSIEYLAGAQDHFENQRYKEVLGIFHSGKAAFGSLGAFEVYHEICALENKIRIHPESEEISFHELERHIGRLKDEIYKYLSSDYNNVNGD